MSLQKYVRARLDGAECIVTIDRVAMTHMVKGTFYSGEEINALLVGEARSRLGTSQIRRCASRITEKYDVEHRFRAEA
jgi:hypothetical protein